MTATVGDRFLDTRGQTWTVLESGQLQNTLAPGVLIRSWDSLDTCLGPLFLLPPDETENDMPEPRQYRDAEGDLWNVREDGTLTFVTGVTDDDDPLVKTLAEASERFGPLTPIPEMSDATKAPIADMARVEDLDPTAADDQPEPDMVNHPPHYTSHPSGVECITVTEYMNFCLGNAMKYLWRAGEKGNKVEDLRKSVFYIQREIARLEDAA